MRKLLPLKSSHGHVEEIEERKKKTLCKAGEKKGSYHSRWRKHRVVFRFALDEWVKGFQVEVKVEKIVGKKGFEESSHRGKLLTQGLAGRHWGSEPRTHEQESSTTLVHLQDGQNFTSVSTVDEQTTLNEPESNLVLSLLIRTSVRYPQSMQSINDKDSLKTSSLWVYCKDV